MQKREIKRTCIYRKQESCHPFFSNVGENEFHYLEQRNYKSSARFDSLLLEKKNWKLLWMSSLHKGQQSHPGNSLWRQGKTGPVGTKHYYYYKANTGCCITLKSLVEQTPERQKVVILNSHVHKSKSKLAKMYYWWTPMISSSLLLYVITLYQICNAYRIR